MSEPSLHGFSLARVGWDDPRAVELRRLVDVELFARYVDPASETVDPSILQALLVDPADVQATVLALDGDGTPIAHGGLRLLRGDWEVKRVVVSGDQRGRGVGRAVMSELERIAIQGGARWVILQTGDRQPEAVALYERLGYTLIPIYEPYVRAMPFSLCFEKVLPARGEDSVGKIAGR